MDQKANIVIKKKERTPVEMLIKKLDFFPHYGSCFASELDAADALILESLMRPLLRQ